MKASNRREVWSKRVQRWKESGLTAKEFAAELGINHLTLRYWKYRLSKPQAPPSVPRFVEIPQVHIESAPQPERAPVVAGPGAIEVVLPGGICLRVLPGFDSECLRKIVEVLESR